MKKLLLLFIVALCTVSVSAQQKLSAQSQKLFDACWALRTAISSGNTSSLKSANAAFRACKSKDFSSLRIVSPKAKLLNGYFVWDEEFVDELVAGRDVRKFAQKYADNRAVRGTGTKGLFTKTLVVGKKGSVKFAFPTRGLEELSVISEPGGRLTLRIYDKRAKKWYNDTEDVKRGRAARTRIINLPEDVVSILEVEVINCSNKDVSFVVLSN